MKRKRIRSAYKALVLAAAALCPSACNSPPDAKLTDACTTLSGLIDAQPRGPAFLPSYPTAQIAALKGTAFLYDNAVATIALVGCGQCERAARIGDAILIALSHDRYWHDGRLRNAYQAGPVETGAVKLPGWWDARRNTWEEDAYQAGSDTGNMAWAILALLALNRDDSSRRYFNAAVRIGTWLAQLQSDQGARGFTGGTFDEEPHPKMETWKSTEQNSDVAAAFDGLAEASGDATWYRRAQIAQQFVRAMWDTACACFDAGTVEDGITPNRFLALDAQIFPLLALPGAANRYASAVMATANRRLRAGRGFAYGQARGGMWTEGTEQTALYMTLSGQKSEARTLTGAAQTMRAPNGGFFAVSTAQLPTGLRLDTNPAQSRQYFHLVHLAPLSWAALVERRYNPFARKTGFP